MSIVSGLTTAENPLYLPKQTIAFFDSDKCLVGCNADFQMFLGLPLMLVQAGTPMVQILKHCLGEEGAATGPAVRDQGRSSGLERCQELFGKQQPVVILLQTKKLVQLTTADLSGGGLSLVATDATPYCAGGLETVAAKLKVVVESISQGISLFDHNLDLVLWNERFCEVMEFPPEQLRPGIPLSELFRFNAERGEYGAGDVELLVADRMELAARFKSHRFIRKLRDGRVIEISGHPVSDGFVTTYTDITEQHKSAAALAEANRQLEQRVSLRTRELEQELDNRIKTEQRLLQTMEQEQLANRAKTEFLANMSHELRTPLNCIIGFSELLKKQIFGPLGQERYVEYCTDINSAGVHLLEVLNDVLDVSKLEAGEIELREVSFDLGEITQASIQIVATRAENSNIAIDTRFPIDLPLLFADPRRVKQVLINLLSNAVKFTPEGGKIEVSASASRQSGLLLTVRDTGIGIAVKDLKRVMEPFVQAGDSLTRKQEGTGLGLHIVGNLMEMHGGTIELESEPGEGTTVTLFFPKERLRYDPLDKSQKAGHAEEQPQIDRLLH
ncbi:PAS-domain containing protein [Kiloniella laminariae]|uniref:histidine kinase n=1 Tax=Kiloniella laminariae TaxID=454162 RepID=A0ABT4LK05_9PROT|nr:PAS-domain containing protein [Kiloniella laminariae]MCZ4281414.1 PAS-domain containing protein [Kiloniella laminariae]